MSVVAPGPMVPTARSAAVVRRVTVFATAAVLAGVDLAAKVWAGRRLDTAPIDLRPLPVELRLTYNPGAAFSLGSDAPAWVMLTVTGVITVAVALIAWRTAPTAGMLWRVALAGILGGAAANVIDRAPDGVVTDYLHTGWWPTFNLADSFIVLGAATLVALTVFGSSHDRHQRSRHD